MRLQFNIRKAIAAATFLLERNNGELDMFLGMKTLYLADKKLLRERGKTITGDSFKSLPKGPVLSMVYKLFKGSAPRDLQVEWDTYFSERVNHSIHALKRINTSSLSEIERESLAWAQEEIRSVAPWEIADWLHQTCPEWEDPNGKSRPIPPEKILRNAGLTETEISRISDSENTYQQTKALLGAR